MFLKAAQEIVLQPSLKAVTETNVHCSDPFSFMKIKLILINYRGK